MKVNVCKGPRLSQQHRDEGYVEKYFLEQPQRSVQHGDDASDAKTCQIRCVHGRVWGIVIKRFTGPESFSYILQVTPDVVRLSLENCSV